MGAPACAERGDSVRASVVLLLALGIAAFTLRAPIASVPPLIGDISDEYGLSTPAAGVLLALPLVCLGVGASFGPPLARRLGDVRGLAACTGASGLGCLLRVAPGPVALYAGTIAACLALAIAGVLLPGVVKRINPGRAGALTGGYVMLLVAGTGAVSGVAVPLEHALGGGVRPTLALMAVPGVLAGILLALRREAVKPARDQVTVRPLRGWIWRDRVAWQVTGFLTLESVVFYSLLSWLPSIVRSHGVSPTTAGVALSVFSLVGIPTALLVPVFAERRSSQTVPIAITTLVMTAGVVGLLVSPAHPLFLWVVILGLGQGGAFGMAMTLLVLRSPDAPIAAELSGMAQTAAYLLAAGGPFVLAVVRDMTGGWTASVALVLAGCIGQLICGLVAGRDRFVVPPIPQPAGGPAPSWT
jgi:CP family cyanate transporter-like MFS transporter